MKRARCLCLQTRIDPFSLALIVYILFALNARTVIEGNVNVFD